MDGYVCVCVCVFCMTALGCLLGFLLSSSFLLPSAIGVANTSSIWLLFPERGINYIAWLRTDTTVFIMCFWFWGRVGFIGWLMVGWEGLSVCLSIVE